VFFKKRKRKIIEKAKGAEKHVDIPEELEARPRRGKIAKVFYALAVMAVWGLMLGIVLFAYLAHDLPDYENPPEPGAGARSVVVKAANGATLVRQGPIYGTFLNYNEIPKSMITALVAVEDRRFFTHSGIDARGLARAIWTNISAGSVRQGASTLTQQLAKNLFLTQDRTLKRKAQEMLLAFWLERELSKEQIITLYLNRVYFGGGTYGIDAASRKFYGHSASQLTIAESAVLAGLVKAPSRLAPHINPDGAWERGQIVLRSMSATGDLTFEAVARISKNRPRIITQGPGADIRYFTDWVIGSADGLIGARGRDLIIYTTLEPAMQVAGSQAIRRGLEGEGAKKKASQAALVALSHDGAVKAMVGGVNYGKSQFNRAVTAKRQPGSTFKLFVYLAALEAGINSSDHYVDEPITVDGWSPKNYSGKNYGDVTALEAFARSLNTVAVKVAEETGREKVASMAIRMGISTPVAPHASLPLGTEEVSVIDLASSYAAVANGGLRAKPYGVVEITSLGGEVLYRHKLRAPRPVLTGDVVDKITPMLKAVITSGSGRNARIDRPAAGKSGTTQDNRDALFAGFTSDLTAVVWVGNDDNTPMSYVTGGGLPARVWADFMIEAHAGAKIRDLHVDRDLYEYDNLYEDAEPVKLAPPTEDTKKKKKSWFEKIFG